MVSIKTNYFKKRYVSKYMCAKSHTVTEIKKRIKSGNTNIIFVKNIVIITS